LIDPYSGREQTKAKHFILRRYLQALAFKVLNYYDITYVDGFSGPWETKTEDFSDTSFMIAITVLQDAQARILETQRKHRWVRCFFSEQNVQAFSRLQLAVKQYHKPERRFEIRTYCGKFEDAVDENSRLCGGVFRSGVYRSQGLERLSFTQNQTTIHATQMRSLNQLYV
jgi:three-Cys-motif partner protein